MSYKYVHDVEKRTIEAQPGIGAGDFSPCLPSWVKTFCEKYEEGEGYHMSANAVNALCHTLIAARARESRLVSERDVLQRRGD